MGQARLELRGVSKRFRRGVAHDTLRDLLAAGLRGLTGRSRSGRKDDTFWALRDVSFEAGQGEAVGVIGPNGAGKSTALKLMAGILRPDEGTIHRRGRLTALIDVGAGFHGDLTGRENIYLNASILGMPRAEIDRQLEAIIAFSGVEPFIDTPVKRYSSGMQARLGFSVAAHVDPDVLLVDEVLSVGDALFRNRCLHRMRRLVEAGATLVFVTHNLDQMQAICRRAVVLDRGRLAFFGHHREAVQSYLSAVAASADDSVVGPDDLRADAVLDVRFLGGDGRECVCTRPNDGVDLEIRYRLSRPRTRLVVAANMRRYPGEHFVNFNSARDACTFDAPAGEGTVRLRLEGLPVAGGQYFWNVRLWDDEMGCCLVETPFRYPLVVEDGGQPTGLLCIGHEWSTGLSHGLQSARTEVRGSNRHALGVCE